MIVTALMLTCFCQYAFHFWKRTEKLNICFGDLPRNRKFCLNYTYNLATEVINHSSHKHFLNVSRIYLIIQLTKTNVRAMLKILLLAEIFWCSFTILFEETVQCWFFVFKHTYFYDHGQITITHLINTESSYIMTKMLFTIHWILWKMR